MSQQMLDDFCEKGTIGDYRVANLQDQINDIDRAMRNTTATYMCTDACLCPMDTDFAKWSEPLLNDNNRTKASVAIVVNGTTYQVMKKAANTSQTTYATFWDCYSKAKNLPTWDSTADISDGLKDLL